MTQVLLVDDDPVICNIIEMCLKRGNIHVVSGHTGEKGLELLADFTPDLIIVDLHIPPPAMNGWDMLARLQAKNITSRIPILVITADPDDGGLQRAYRLGAKSHLIKPFDREELTKAVTSLLEISSPCGD